jgi:hypothetical protein
VASARRRSCEVVFLSRCSCRSVLVFRRITRARKGGCAQITRQILHSTLLNASGSDGQTPPCPPVAALRRARLGASAVRLLLGGRARLPGPAVAHLVPAVIPTGPRLPRIDK